MIRNKSNPVAKNLNKFNKPATHRDRKKDAKKGERKHKGRDYAKEYANYHSRPDQVKRRTARNAARRAMSNRKELTDEKDVHHKDNNPMNNDKSNLAIVTQHYNRREPRLRNEAVMVTRMHDLKGIAQTIAKDAIDNGSNKQVMNYLKAFGKKIKLERDPNSRSGFKVRIEQKDSVEEGKWFVRQSAKPNKTGTYQGKKFDDGKKAIAQARKDWKLTPDEHMSAKMMKEDVNVNRTIIFEGVEMNEATTVSRNDFDKMKKGSKIEITYGSSISSSQTRTFQVKSKTRSAKYNVDKVNMVDPNKPGGMKFHLYSRGGKDATLALGDMAATIKSYKILGESVNLDEDIRTPPPKQAPKKVGEIAYTVNNINRNYPKLKWVAKKNTATSKAYKPLVWSAVVESDEVDEATILRTKTTKQQSAASKEKDRKNAVKTLGDIRKGKYKGVKMANEDDDPCWDSHKQVGMKKKGGKMVPNCVPKNEETVLEQAMINEFSDAQLAQLKKAYSDLERINVTSPTYKKLKAMIANMDVKALEKVARAKVRFVSQIAAREYEKKSGNRLKAKDYMESVEEKSKGLWYNIRKKRERGEPKAKPGDKDYPKTLDIETKEEVELDEKFSFIVRDKDGKIAGGSSSEREAKMMASRIKGKVQPLKKPISNKQLDNMKVMGESDKHRVTEVDTGQYAARKKPTSSKQAQQSVFDKHRERMRKLRKESIELDEAKTFWDLRKI